MSEIEPSILLFAGRFTVRGSCSYSLRLAEQLPLQGMRSVVVCPDGVLSQNDGESFKSGNFLIFNCRFGAALSYE